MQRETRSKLAAALVLLAAAAAAAGQEIDLLLRQGALELERGDPESAERAYRRAILADSVSVAARIGLARARTAHGEPAAAATELVDAAQGWVEAGAYGPAVELLEEAVRLAPGSHRALAQLGRARVLDRRYLAAAEPLERLDAAGAADPQSLLYLASALWENGEVERAEGVLRRAIEASGRSFPALQQLGRLLLWAGRYEEAARVLAECGAARPEAADLALDLARALDGAGDSAGALAAYRRAVELLPEHSEARYGLAMELLRGGDRAAAERELAIYRRLYEEDQRRVMREGLERARIDRGRELLRAGRVAEAVEHLSGLAESPDSLAALARALRAAGDLAAAVERLQRAVALAPGREDLRALLNEVRLEQLGGGT